MSSAIRYLSGPRGFALLKPRFGSIVVIDMKAASIAGAFPVGGGPLVEELIAVSL